jgi:hypothetical protein
MRTSKELLIELTRRGVILWVLHGQIRYTAPQGTLTPDLKRDLIVRKDEILTLYSGSQISDSLNRIADVWDADIESRGEGDAAWAWIKASDHWQIIRAAEDELDRIGKHGNADELNAACSKWIASWVEAIAAWSDRCRDMDRVKIVQRGAVQSKNC